MRLCPHTTILATSREILRIDGEYVYRVPPLDVPALGQEDAGPHTGATARWSCSSPGQRRWTRASRRAPKTSQSIAAICRHLDGIPLAIEFAAARAATLGIAAGGRRPARSLRAVDEWTPHGAAAASDPARDARLELRAAAGSRAAAAASPGRILRRLHRRGRRRGDGGYRARCRDGDGWHRQPRREVAGRAGPDVGASRWYLLETIRAYALEKLVEHRRSDGARGGTRRIFAISSHAGARCQIVVSDRGPARRFERSTTFARRSTGPSPRPETRRLASISQPPMRRSG